MSGRYTPQVGDRVQRRYWVADQWYDVTAVGRRNFLGIDSDGDESQQSRAGDWVKVETPAPLPDCWHYITTNGVVSYPKDSRDEAFDHAGMDIAAILHIWTDADGVDHAEIERVAL